MEGRVQYQRDTLKGGKMAFSLSNSLSQFFQSDSGASSVEYGLLIAFIAGAIFTAVATFGQGIANAFTTYLTKFNAATGS